MLAEGKCKTVAKAKNICSLNINRFAGKTAPVAATGPEATKGAVESRQTQVHAISTAMQRIFVHTNTHTHTQTHTHTHRYEYTCVCTYM